MYFSTDSTNMTTWVQNALNNVADTAMLDPQYNWFSKEADPVAMNVSVTVGVASPGYCESACTEVAVSIVFQPPPQNKSLPHYTWFTEHFKSYFESDVRSNSTRSQLHPFVTAGFDSPYPAKPVLAQLHPDLQARSVRLNHYSD